jgi:hypothetical protein
VRGEDVRRRLLVFVVLAVLVAPSLALAARDFSMKVGATFTITGRTGSDTGKQSRAVGKVVLSGRWGVGPWRALTTTTTDSGGNYKFVLKPHRRGDLTLRISPPDHHARRYLLHVV